MLNYFYPRYYLAEGGTDTGGRATEAAGATDVRSGSADYASTGYAERTTTPSVITTFQTSGRNTITAPQPPNAINTNGIVAVKVKINKSGKVINAIPGAKGTNTTNKYFLDKSKEAALDTTFVPKETDIEKEEGVIVYTFNSSSFSKPKISTRGKVINSIHIQDVEKPIKQDGERRRVDIKGTENAMYTITVKTSSGCSILSEEIENFKLPVDGKHSFHIAFPKIDASISSETYEFEMIPSADTTIYKEVINGTQLPTRIQTKKTIYQYKDPTITFTNTSTQTGPALSVSGSDVTKTGPALTRHSDISGQVSSTYALTITENPDDTEGFFYVNKNVNFRDNITSDKVVRKIVRRETSGDNTVTKTLRLDPAPAVSTGSAVTDTGMITDSDGNISGDLYGDMIMSGSVSYTKTVVSSVDTNNCYIPTDKFKLIDTNNLFEDMEVEGRGIFGSGTKILKIDCDEKIVTLSSRHIIKKDTELTFKHNVNGWFKVHSNMDSEGKACIELYEPQRVPDRIELSFDRSKTSIEARVKQSGSGTNSVTLSSEIKILEYGTEDVTYTLNLDNFITKTPNAYDQDVDIKKETATSIYLLAKDTDDNATDKTATVVKNPQHGTVGSWNATRNAINYEPHTGFTGQDSFTFTVSDGVNSSSEKRVFITVN